MDFKVSGMGLLIIIGWLWGLVGLLHFNSVELQPGEVSI